MKKNSERQATDSQRLFLYLDTSEPAATVSVYLCQGPTLAKCESRTLLGEERWLAHRELSATLSSKYEALLKVLSKKLYPAEPFNHLTIQQSLSGIVVFVGPGSFTGLRIGISFANGLAYALGIPVYETKTKGTFIIPKSQSAKGGPASGRKIALPFYGAEPNITKPKNK